jgi:diguanylate cyclase (GGDEF)-like protein/PAS domain S-box-containing protein
MTDSEDPDLVSLLYAQAPSAILAGVGNGALLVVAAWGSVLPAVLTLWMAAILTLTLLRIGLVRGYRNRTMDGPGAGIWGRRYVYSAWASGLLWGAAGVILVGTHRLELQVFTAFILGGMTAGAVAANVSNRAAFYAFALPALLPLPPLFLLEGSRLHVVMAVLTFAFLVLMSRAALRFQDTLRRSLQLDRDKAALLNDMRVALERLEASEAGYRNLFDLNPLMYFTLDASGVITNVNALGASQLGYRVEELTGRSVLLVFPDKAHETVRAQINLCLHELNHVHSWEAEKVRKDGSLMWVRETGVAIRLREGHPSVLIMCEDITEHKEAADKIHRLAYFDPLTNLPNRRLFMDRLGHALAASKRSGDYAALMILDLDNFKTLNDTQGHDVGDRLLVEVAGHLKATVREEDSVARLGGDEYVVLIEDLGADESTAANQAEMVAEKIRMAVHEPCTISAYGQPYSGTTSIGLTLFRGEEIPIEVLLKQADLALYRAKDAGRNAIRFFNPLMQAAIDERSAMESALRHGIGRGELRLFYQPQVDRAGVVRGAEALLRWFPAHGEPVPPAQFIPVAEETGLILPIGRWILDTACAQLKVWEACPSTRDLQLTVNVSVLQFHQSDFVGQVEQALVNSGVDPARLKLELTESMVLGHVDEIIDKMHRLKALGIGFSLDDFGTGYSSLACLKRLPLEQIKIDQSFVRDIPQDQNDAAIVRAILAMSGSLGLQVVAEGVENRAQRDFLMASGCALFQGYLFGEPMPAEHWQRLLSQPRARDPESGGTA